MYHFISLTVLISDVGFWGSLAKILGLVYFDLENLMTISYITILLTPCITYTQIAINTFYSTLIYLS